MTCIYRSAISVRNHLILNNAFSLVKHKIQVPINLKSHATFVRTIFCSNHLLVKLYHDTENSFAHSVMEDNNSYKNTIISSKMLIPKSTTKERFLELVEEDYDTKSCEEIVKYFNELASYANQNNMRLSSSEFDNITKAIVNHKSNFSDSQIAELLIKLSFFMEEDGVKDRNFYDVWSALDDTCKSRSAVWDVDQMLYYADLWHNIKLVRHSDFINKSLTKIGRKIKNLSPRHLIQTMFYINLARRSVCTMFDFEKSLHTCLYDLSIHEIAIMAMGFFKTKTPIRNPHLLEHIIYRTIESADTVHEIALCAIAKIIRYSLPISLQQSLAFLMENLIKQIPRLSMQCCVHIALLGTNLQMYNPNLIDEIANKFDKNISTTRLKDMERLAFALTLFNYNDKGNNIYCKILNELKNPHRSEELTKYPRALACCLYYISLRGLYDSDLLNRVLNDSFITNTYGDGYFNIGREILCIDASIDVELPEYNGCKLNGVLRQKIAKKYTRNIDPSAKLHRGDILIMEILTNVQKLFGGEKYAACVHILPHYEKPDILIAVDNDGKPQSMVWQNLFETGAVHTIDQNESKWIVLVAAAKNQLLFGSYNYTGPVLAKLRQLETLGYLPVVVPWYEWFELPDNKKEFYLKNKIDTGINEYAYKESNIQ